MKKTIALLALAGGVGFASIASAVPAIGENGGHEVPAYGSTMSTQPEADVHQANRIGGGAVSAAPWGWSYGGYAPYASSYYGNRYGNGYGYAYGDGYAYGYGRGSGHAYGHAAYHHRHHRHDR